MDFGTDMENYLISVYIYTVFKVLAHFLFIPPDSHKSQSERWLCIYLMFIEHLLWPDVVLTKTHLRQFLQL